MNSCLNDEMTAYKNLLPPGFELVTLRENQDAHSVALAHHEKGAGTFFWVKRFDVAEFALILEPDEPLLSARRAFYIGMNALADTLSFHAPADKSVTFKFPDALLLDGGLIGGGRLGYPLQDETKQTDWLVFSGMIRLSIIGISETGHVAGATSLEDEGGEEISAENLVYSFARHFMSGVHSYLTEGMKPIAANYFARLEKTSKEMHGIDGNGDLLVGKSRTSLVEALAPVSWFDRTSGAPKL